jgi:polygalacturonase
VHFFQSSLRKTAFHHAVFCGIFMQTKMKYLPAIFLSFTLAVHAKEFNVRDFGAMGDGKTLDTSAIQKTIDAATAAGGGTVLIPRGQFLTGPLQLASRINFHLATNAVILISDDMANYPIVKNRYQDAIIANDAHDLEISGEGTIDGQGAAWWRAFRANPKMTHRPYLIKLTGCTGLKVSGITLKNSPMFHLVPQSCTDVVIQGITIKVTTPKSAANTDGIDPSGWNFLIADCVIDTGDDNIAIKPGTGSGRNPGNKNFIVKNCTFLHGHGMSIGGGTASGIQNLTVSNCIFTGTDYGIRVKTLRGNGGLLADCTYENLTMTRIVKSPISIVDYYPERTAPKNPATEEALPVTDRTPFNKNITIRNVTANDCPNAGIIRGLPEAPIDGLTFSNVNLSAKTGMIIYHAQNVRFSNSKITAEKGDALKTFDADVTGLK